MNEECIHDYIEDNGIEYCIICGKEELLIQHIDISLTKEYYVNENYRLLGDLSESQKKSVNDLAESILNRNSLRGNRKKAIIAVCYMYLNFIDGIFYTCDDIIKKFSIDKKKFSFAVRSFLHTKPEYRVLILYARNFSSRIADKFPDVKIDKKKVELLCDSATEKNKLLTNLNPYNVCACVVYKHFLEPVIRRCTFIKTVKISDSSMQKIIALMK